MIARLRGTVWEVGGGRLVVDVGGVGYEVQVPETTLVEFGIAGVEVNLFVRQIVREDDISLYGFSASEDRALFDLLRDVQGCGSKTSLALIGTLGASGVRDAIAFQDHKSLVKAPGVGPRLAERIAVTLKDKVLEIGLELKARGVAAVAPRKAAAEPEDEVVSALLALGYPRNKAEAAVADSDAAQPVEERIRAALRVLAR